MIGCSRQGGEKGAGNKTFEIWYSLDSGEFVNNHLHLFLLVVRGFVGHAFGGWVASLLEKSFWET